MSDTTSPVLQERNSVGSFLPVPKQPIYQFQTAGVWGGLQTAETMRLRMAVRKGSTDHKALT